VVVNGVLAMVGGRGKHNNGYGNGCGWKHPDYGNYCKCRYHRGLYLDHG